MKRGILIFLLVFGLACDDPVPTQQITAPPVFLEAVELHDVVDRIEATGQLVARSEATVAAEVAGRVTRMAVEEGVHVDEGDLVIEIDPERRQLEVEDSARARLSSRPRRSSTRPAASANHERIREAGGTQRTRCRSRELDEARTRHQLRARAPALVAAQAAARPGGARPARRQRHRPLRRADRPAPS